MATKETKVTAGAVVSSTRKYSNEDDATRVFNISADVNIRNGKVENINSGSLVTKESTNIGSANFSCGNDFNYFSFNSNNMPVENTKEAFNAVLQFVKDVESDVASLTD